MYQSTVNTYSSIHATGYKSSDNYQHSRRNKRQSKPNKETPGTTSETSVQTFIIMSATLDSSGTPAVEALLEARVHVPWRSELRQMCRV